MGLLEITLKTWWSSLSWPRGRGSAFRLIASSAVFDVLFLLWASHPAAAAGDELRVIAVNTAAAPRVSMVVEPPVTPPQYGSEEESCTVTIDGESVATTVSPVASGDLSVALVIDTASDLTSPELAAVQSGAIDFLLGLPQEANSMVVAAGGKPQVVAPLNAHPAEALSAISALEVGGSRATSAATRLAAESLQSGPPGPRVIIVYTGGPDEQSLSVEQLSEAVMQANAVVNVIPTGAESVWPSVVDRTGGVVLPPTDTGDIAASYGHLATILSEQYVVTFQAPVELPAVAQVAFQSGDQEYRTVVNLPDADTEQAAPTDGRGIVGLVSLVVAGLVLIVLAVLALVRRTRRRASVGISPPDEAAGPPAGTPPVPAIAMPATEKEDGDSSSNGAPSSTLTAAPATSPPPSRRGSLSAAVQGRRSAEQALNSAAQQQVEHSPDDQQQEAAPNAKPALPHTSDSVSHPDKEGRRTSTDETALRFWAKNRRQRSAEEGHDGSVVLTGSGDAVVELTKNAPRPAVVFIWGNAAREYFSIRTMGTDEVLVITTEPYDGVRSLDWDGGEATGFRVCATGPWRIEVLPLSAVPSFRTSLTGEGDMVVHFTGHGSCAEISGNDAGRYFTVRAFSPNGTDSLVDTKEAYSGSRQISGEPQYFEVHADGPWNITVN